MSNTDHVPILCWLFFWSIAALGTIAGAIYDFLLGNYAATLIWFVGVSVAVGGVAGFLWEYRQWKKR